ncbi:GtrA family protein [Arthrobacter gengyunqii]|uniref:GtrA family protein n=1 Tax=Arthrobacter gengyunqii TaxID=2886940 RepID=A0A9X1S609_9MICC|nr:GtrA family protein [Arthrobacter gengyunqii]MCC3265829.1 GtrA family protein [Arthrobacter gengyunqii]MCC3268586.1 GtrA family protein [Arthrobacter gengyunqii]UOY95974.1 GtrA family protein [Arthrobacter gengyunqii]
MANHGISPVRKVLRRLGSFSLVGAVAFVVDVSLFNVLASTVLDDSPITAKVISVAAATTVSWVGSRYLTFRSTRGRSVRSETLLFALTNVVGLLIATGCLFVSHYLLGFTSQFADNISGNVVGVLAGNVFRYFAYRYVVFTTEEERAARSALKENV